MKLTPALYVRQFLATLHPPLPKSPRESQRLLNLLDASFRKHLDEAHPPPNARNESNDESGVAISLASLASSSAATRHHLTSVLAHPLLGQISQGKHTFNSRTGRALQLFHAAVAQGRIGIDLVTKCVSQYLTGLKQGEQVESESRLSTQVASWLQSASVLEKQAFFLVPGNVARTVDMMVLDEEEANAWSLLQMIYERDFGPEPPKPDLTDPSWLQVEDDFVASLMLASIRRKELADAAQQYLEACKYRQASGRAAALRETATSTMKYVPMARAWKRLASSIIFHRHQHNIEGVLYGDILSFAMVWSDDPIFSPPFLQIYHPLEPSAQSLCTQLRDKSMAARLVTQLASQSRYARTATLVALLDAAEMSVESGARQNAELLLNFAGEHCMAVSPDIASGQTAGLFDRLLRIRRDLQASRQIASAHLSMG